MFKHQGLLTKLLCEWLPKHRVFPLTNVNCIKGNSMQVSRQTQIYFFKSLFICYAHLNWLFLQLIWDNDKLHYEPLLHCMVMSTLWFKVKGSLGVLCYWTFLQDGLNRYHSSEQLYFISLQQQIMLLVCTINFIQTCGKLFSIGKIKSLRCVITYVCLRLFIFTHLRMILPTPQVCDLLTILKNVMK